MWLFHSGAVYTFCIRQKTPALSANVFNLGVIAKPVRRLVVAISFCLGDSQEVNCRMAARETTLGCASVSTGSE